MISVDTASPEQLAAIGKAVLVHLDALAQSEAELNTRLEKNPREFNAMRDRGAVRTERQILTALIDEATI